MSRASEYAEACRQQLAKSPGQFHIDPNYSVASVSADGSLIIAGVHMKPERALALAKWITDTFGEPHVCDLPDSIKEALNSGDGVYRP